MIPYAQLFKRRSLRELLTGWRTLNADQLTGRIRQIQDTSTVQHITPAQWDIVDKMRWKLKHLERTNAEISRRQTQSSIRR